MNPTEEMMADDFARSMQYLIQQFSANSDIPYEGMQHFSCAETEALAEVIKLGALPLGLAADGQTAAAMLIAAHAVGDQPGDAHYIEAGTVVSTYSPDSSTQWFVATGRPNSHGHFTARRVSRPLGEPHGEPLELHIAGVEVHEIDDTMGGLL